MKMNRNLLRISRNNYYQNLPKYQEWKEWRESKMKERSIKTATATITTKLIKSNKIRTAIQIKNNNLECVRLYLR